MEHAELCQSLHKMEVNGGLFAGDNLAPGGTSLLPFDGQRPDEAWTARLDAGHCDGESLSAWLRYDALQFDTKKRRHVDSEHVKFPGDNLSNILGINIYAVNVLHCMVRHSSRI
jgi:hypothetical protein